jgi:hypothetical protein
VCSWKRLACKIPFTEHTSYSLFSREIFFLQRLPYGSDFAKLCKFRKKNLPGWHRDILELMSGSEGRGSRVGGDSGARTGFSGGETGLSGEGKIS